MSVRRKTEAKAEQTKGELKKLPAELGKDCLSLLQISAAESMRP
ncbi:hypothetical protein GCM10010272_53690 [Streptomyces lateritius]|nr:hypothetical protein GCM10010272_53690 [Streptomyces lateritius]